MLIVFFPVDISLGTYMMLNRNMELRLYQALIERYSKTGANLVTRTGYFGIDQDRKEINILCKN